MDPRFLQLPVAPKKPTRAPYQPKPRYYSYALTTEDKVALVAPENEDEGPSWTRDDLLKFQESRRDLIPRGMSNSEQMWVELEQELEEEQEQEPEEQEQEQKQDEEQEKKARKSAEYVREIKGKVRRRLAAMKLVPETKVTGPDGEDTEADFYQKLEDEHQRPQLQRRASVPMEPVFFPRGNMSFEWLPRTPSIEQLRPTSYFDGVVAAPVVQRRRRRVSSTGEYNTTSRQLDHPLRLHPRVGRRTGSQPPAGGGPASPTTEGRSYQYRPDVTFDGFLAPHASGKGWAYRGAENAKE